jgi:ankyrin repeat protein
MSKNVQDNLLLKAAQDGDIDGAKAALEKGANPNVLNDDWTPLLLAAAKGHVGVVKTLIEHKADVNGVNRYDWTPMYVAAQGRHRRC